MKIVVTGGAGFIGSHLCHRLLIESNNVLAVDSFRNYYSIDLKKYRIKEIQNQWTETEFRFYEADMVQDDIWRTIREYSPNAIIHLAAQPGVRQGTKGSELYVQDNVLAFLKVLGFIEKNPSTALLYASSSSVYGKKSNVPFVESANALQPMSIYGVTKLANELLVEAVLAESNVRIRGLRFFTAYGPAGRPDMAYFRAITSALLGTPFHKFGTGESMRDFTFVTDITNSIIRLLNELIHGERSVRDVVNIGGGKPHSLNDLIQGVEKLAKRKINIIEKEKNSNDLAVTHADFTYLHSLIGDQSFTELEEGLCKTFEWFSKIPPQTLMSWLGDL